MMVLEYSVHYLSITQTFAAKSISSICIKLYANQKGQDLLEKLARQ
jgi:hypothetical protein